MSCTYVCTYLTDFGGFGLAIASAYVGSEVARPEAFPVFSGVKWAELRNQCTSYVAYLTLQWNDKVA